MTVEQLAQVLSAVLTHDGAQTSSIDLEGITQNLEIIACEPWSFVVRDYVTGREFRVTVADREQPLLLR